MKTTIEKLISEQIAQEEDYIREHEQIKAILQPLEGQAISGRVLNKKKLSAFSASNGYDFTLCPQYGMFYIKGKYEHLIGYDSEPIIYIDKVGGVTRGFKYFDACHGSAALARIDQLKNIDVDRMALIFGQIQKDFDNIRTCFGDIERSNLGGFHNPVYYNVLRSIYHDKENRYKIQLSDFYFIRK
jgi:hypothetical protein